MKLVWALVYFALIYRKNVVYCTETGTDQSGLSTESQPVPTFQTQSQSSRSVPVSLTSDIYPSGSASSFVIDKPVQSQQAEETDTTQTASEAPSEPDQQPANESDQQQPENQKSSTPILEPIGNLYPESFGASSVVLHVPEPSPETLLTQAPPDYVPVNNADKSESQPSTPATSGEKIVMYEGGFPDGHHRPYLVKPVDKPKRPVMYEGGFPDGWHSRVTVEQPKQSNITPAFPAGNLYPDAVEALFKYVPKPSAETLLTQPPFPGVNTENIVKPTSGDQNDSGSTGSDPNGDSNQSSSSLRGSIASDVGSASPETDGTSGFNEAGDVTTGQVREDKSSTPPPTVPNEQSYTSHPIGNLYPDVGEDLVGDGSHSAEKAETGKIVMYEGGFPDGHHSTDLVEDSKQPKTQTQSGSVLVSLPSDIFPTGSASSFDLCKTTQQTQQQPVTTPQSQSGTPISEPIGNLYPEGSATTSYLNVDEASKKGSAPDASSTTPLASGTATS